MAKILFDGDHLQVLYDDRGGETLLVTFNEMDSFANGINYWSELPAKNLDISTIGVITKRRNWFPFSDMIQAYEVIKPLLGYDIVISYGFSQGAYGAIKYSYMFNTSYVLAFSPQWSINPLDVGDFDKRFIKHFDRDLHRNMAIKPNEIIGDVRIFSDYYEKTDYLNAIRISHLRDRVIIVPCFNIGHGTVRAVASTKALAHLIKCCERHNIDKSNLFQFIREQKKETFAYFFALGQTAIRRKHTKLANNLYIQASKINNNHPYLSDWRNKLDELSDGAIRV